MEPVIIPLYLNWSFWAVIVAIAAIALSQISPIHILIKKAKLEIELYSKISITHRVGNPNLQCHLIINNIGGRKIRVKDIGVSIERDNKSIISLSAQNYLQKQHDKNYVLFTTFALNPSDEWAHIVNFLNFFDRENEKEYQTIESSLLNDFQDKRTKLTDEPSSFIELDPDLVKPLEVFFEKHFIWSPGEYTMTINVITEKNKANISKKFRFTVFESQSEQLKKITEHFKYGGGTWWDPKIQTSVILEVKEA